MTVPGPIPALELHDLAISFGGVHAVAGVSAAIQPGEFVGLIGPNGAGKTTLLRLIVGVLEPDAGRVLLSGADITGRSTAARVRKGLAMTHQIVRPLRSMTVLENVTLAAGARRIANPLTALFSVDRRAEEERAAEIIARVGLGGTEHKEAAALPLGQLKRLEVARALALDPIVVLLDEPLAGLNHAEAERQIDVIAQLNASGITVVLIEHNLQEVLRVCRRLLVLDAGRLLDDGAPAAVMANEAVREAYIGKGAADAAA